MSTLPQSNSAFSSSDSQVKLHEQNDVLTTKQRDQFHDQGYLLLRDFYCTETQIRPIQEHIYRMISMLIEQSSLAVHQKKFQCESFDNGYQELIADDRRWGGVLYDAVKQIPAFQRLICNPIHEQVIMELRESSAVGVGSGGSGIRIDNPNEEKFRAAWHQDYPSQLRSEDGIVFWSPLVSITREMGPVELCPQSHREGLVPMNEVDSSNGAYALRLQDEQQRISKYKTISPLLEPGDLLLIDYKTIHRSGSNVSNRSRWSMQMRYFNFEHSSGRQRNWIGGYAAGHDPKDVHPELFSTK